MCILVSIAFMYCNSSNAQSNDRAKIAKMYLSAVKQVSTKANDAGLITLLKDLPKVCTEIDEHRCDSIPGSYLYEITVVVIKDSGKEFCPFLEELSADITALYSSNRKTIFVKESFIKDTLVAGVLLSRALYFWHNDVVNQISPSNKNYQVYIMDKMFGLMNELTNYQWSTLVNKTIDSSYSLYNQPFDLYDIRHDGKIDEAFSLLDDMFKFHSNDARDYLYSLFITNCNFAKIQKENPSEKWQSKKKKFL